MNKNFDKEQKQKRLLAISNLAAKPAIKLDRVGQIKHAFMVSLETTQSLQRFLQSVKKADFNADLIFALSFFRIYQIQEKNKVVHSLYKQNRKRSFQVYDIKDNQLSKTINKYYKPRDAMNVSSFYQINLSSPMKDFWINVFAKVPGYDEYFFTTGKYYSTVSAMIEDFDVIAEAVSLHNHIAKPNKDNSPDNLGSHKNKI